MTRINTGVDPQELCDKHLLAEHREIKRIPNCIKSGRYSLDNQPNEFKLGTGHVKFFYDKIKYLHNRYNKIYVECISRGLNVSDFSSCFDDIPSELYNDYTETSNDRNIILKRINERLKVMKGAKKL